MKLSHKILLLIIGMILVSAAGFQIIFYFSFEGNLLKSEIEEVKSVSELASKELQNHVYFLEIDKINSIIKNLKQNESFESVQVILPDGTVLSDGQSYNLPSSEISNDELAQQVIQDGTTMVKRTQDLLMMATPIIMDKTIGALRVDYSLDEFNLILYNSLISTILYTLLVSTVGVIVGFIVVKSITDPITRLRSSANEIARGNFNVKIKYSGSDEIRDLEKDICWMTNKLKDSQKQLLRKEKLATIGQLSARVAHDLRNPLAVVQNSKELIKMNSNLKDQKIANYFGSLERGLARINHQVDDVLNFLRPIKLDVHTCSVNEIIDLSINSLKVPSKVTITKDYPDKPYQIEADSKKLQTVFTNIILNAIQAVGESGKITIRINEDTNHITIEFEDSANKLTKKDLDNIFEPLFTTKQEGTGLGLPSCKTIVEQHNGEIFAKINPTIFCIKLPKKYKTEFEKINSMN